MPSRRSRRDVLATAAALAATGLSGCADHGFVDGGDPERRLVLTLYREDGPLSEAYVTAPNETRSPVDDEAFAAALAGETYTTQHRPPFGAREGRPEYARHDGTYYRLGSVVVDEVTTTHPVVRLYEVGDLDELDTVPDHVSKEKLRRGDQRAVHVAWFAARARDNQGGVPWGLVERDGYVYRRPEAIEDSDLLESTGPDYVAFRERLYEVEVSRETFHEAVYRAEVEPVADSKAQLERILRARLVDARLDPDALTQGEREVIEAARREGYGETHPYSEAYESLLKRMQHWPYLDGDVENDAGDFHDQSLRVLQYGERYFQYRLAFRTPGD